MTMTGIMSDHRCDIATVIVRTVSKILEKHGGTLTPDSHAEIARLIYRCQSDERLRRLMHGCCECAAKCCACEVDREHDPFRIAVREVAKEAEKAAKVGKKRKVR